MIHVDLFSGFGMMALGIQRAGFDTRLFCEIEPYAQKVLRKHWPETPIESDVRNVSADTLRRYGIGSVDLLTGGFPCQDISVAGQGAGLEGERSGLWYEMLRVIRECRPAFCLIENVPALRTRGADTILQGLEAAGYAAECFVVGADDCGAPHRRKRVWIVAYTPEQSGSGYKDVAHANTAGRGERCWEQSGGAEFPSTERGHKGMAEWQRVVFAGDCKETEDGDFICPVCSGEYGECPCPGPTMDGYEYVERDGVLYARPEQEAKNVIRLFPPARNDFRSWAAVAEVEPSLMPCVERPVRGVVDGIAPELVRRHRGQRTDSSQRTAQLKGLGNGLIWVIPYLIGTWIREQINAA